MNPLRYGVHDASTKLVCDTAYPEVLRSMIINAKERCLCSLFIVDLCPKRDKELLVHSILVELQAAMWRGVDVRLIIGGSRSNFGIAELSEAARRRANLMGIPVGWLTATDRRGSHTKTVVVDDCVLTGSHNWSVGAFTNQTQDSTLVLSSGLANFLASGFEYQWRNMQETSNVPI